ADDFDFESAWRAVGPEAILALISTSGTTGPPKGVPSTHANICETVRSYDEMIQFPDGGRIVSYLPMAHVAERNVSHYLPMLCGFTITCCPDAREVISYLPEVRPTWFFAVPRIWEKLKAALEQMLAAAPEEQREATQAAIDASLEKVRLEQRGEFDDDGYLRIVDRKKELIITAARKNLSPAISEARLKQIPLVSQAGAIGARRKFISALRPRHEEAAKAGAKEKGIDGIPGELA